MALRFFVTAIGTDSGKTIFSSILCEALGADYWKPVQAGLPGDTDTVRSLVSNKKTFFHEEGIKLKTPASPHAAGKKEEVEVSTQRIEIPQSTNHMVIEGAGGVLVPLNDNENVIDLAVKYNAEVIVVSNLYLGSINHTLLTLDWLNKNNIPVRGIVFNGDPNPESQEIILKRSGLEELLHIYKEEEITKKVIKKYAERLREKL
ncbi:dethiobiotin synthase [Marinigracilibium pacificum]|uniref:ATP-dependent dethiobiotin synthetase BioD n=1 Tax=Marinigracilibium pacificum TaxID=2729599 RepID=A0A848J4I2_9BACT|nr:dethiobiotin synthase [Marinigracilibium pacificum]NMM50208.1 dethiobiotin synthase [Marinigracilibium pacificum]